MLCMCTPAGQEEFFLAVADPLANRDTPPPKLTGEEQAARGKTAKGLAAKFRTEFLV